MNTAMKGRGEPALELWHVLLLYYHRHDESWKIVNFHYSVNMFDNPVVDKAMGKIAMIGSGALVLGLLIGFFLGRRRA